MNRVADKDRAIGQLNNSLQYFLIEHNETVVAALNTLSAKDEAHRHHMEYAAEEITFLKQQIAALQDTNMALTMKLAHSNAHPVSAETKDTSVPRTVEYSAKLFQPANQHLIQNTSAIQVEGVEIKP